LTIIKNNDVENILVHRLARIIVLDFGARTLPEIEAFASMIKNQNRDLSEYKLSHIEFIDSDSKIIQVAVRVIRRMIRGVLPDSIFGATTFHHIDENPEWAFNIGYIAEVGDFLFYK